MDHLDAIVLAQREAGRLLDEDRLLEALDFVCHEAEAAMTPANAPFLQSVLSDAMDLRDDYERMRCYFVSDHADPGRADQFDRLMERARRLVDDLRPSAGVRPSYYHRQLMDETLPLYKRCYLLSELTFYLLAHFDESLVERLYIYTLEDQPVELRVRAWVAIALVALRHHGRIAHQPRLQEQLRYIAETMHEADNTADNLMLRLQILLLQSTDAIRAKELLHATIHQIVTGYAQQFFKDDDDEATAHADDPAEADAADPDAAASPEAPAAAGQGEAPSADGRETEDDGASKAPEGKGRKKKVQFRAITLNLNDASNQWLRTREGRRLKNQIDNYISLVSDGTDAQLDSFEMAMHLPFFRDSAEHWLIPFSLDYPEVAEMLEARPALRPLGEAIMRVSNCDTDKFAHFVMAARSKASTLERLQEMTQMLNGEAAPDHSTEGRDEAGPTEAQRHAAALKRMGDAMRAYVQDLYRYCHYSGRVDEELNPFRQPLLFTACPWLNASIDKPAEQKAVAEYLFRKGRFAEAYDVLARLTAVDITEDNLQKLAIAALKCEPPKVHAAVDALRRCHHYFPEEVWTVEALGDLLANLDEWLSLELLLRPCLEEWKDRYSLHLLLARSLMGQGRYREALEPLYHCDMLREGKAEVQRYIAEACLMTSALDSAEHYVGLLLARRKSTCRDWLLGGHIALAAGQTRLAVERYEQALRRGRRSKEWDDRDAFIRAFMDYPRDLAKAGISPGDLAIARDTIGMRPGRKS